MEVEPRRRRLPFPLSLILLLFKASAITGESMLLLLAFPGREEEPIDNSGLPNVDVTCRRELS